MVPYPVAGWGRKVAGAVPPAAFPPHHTGAMWDLCIPIPWNPIGMGKLLWPQLQLLCHPPGIMGIHSIGLCGSHMVPVWWGGKAAGDAAPVTFPPHPATG